MPSRLQPPGAAQTSALPRPGSSERGTRTFQNTAVRTQTSEVRRPRRAVAARCLVQRRRAAWRRPAGLGTASGHWDAVSSRVLASARHSSVACVFACLPKLKDPVHGEWSLLESGCDDSVFQADPGEGVCWGRWPEGGLGALGIAPGVSGPVGVTGRTSLARYQQVWAPACKTKFCNVITF